MQNEQKSESELKRAKQFRESRINLPEHAEATIEFSDSYKNPIHGTLLNLSEFGAQIKLSESENFVRIGSTLKNVVMTVCGKSIFTGEVKLVNEAVSVDGLFLIYGVMTRTPIDLDRLSAIIGLADNSNISRAKNILKIAQTIRPEFKLLLSDFVTFHQELRTRLNEEDQLLATKVMNKAVRRKKEQEIINLTESLYSQDMLNLFTQFGEIFRTLDPEELEDHRRYFRSCMHPLVLTDCPFISRAFSKPQGYPGDYGLMVMLYEYEDMGPSLFHKAWHRFSCNSPTAIANKNRVKLLNNHLFRAYQVACDRGDKSFKITTVACGPAKEIELFLQDLPQKSPIPIEVILVDQDQSSLSYAQSRIKPLSASKENIKVSFFAEDAVLGVIRQRPFVEEMKGSDIIISAGLFDYLSDRVSKKLITTLFKELSPKGAMYIGNVASYEPDVFAMDFVMDWNLIHRTRDDLDNLVEDEIRAQSVDIDVINEEIGLNLFLVIKKKS